MPYDIDKPRTAMSESESTKSARSLMAITVALATPESDALRRLKILIINDEQFEVELLQRYLVHGKFENFVSTTDSRCAVELFQKIGPDLVLIDWLMPHLSGLAVIQQLRALIGSDDYLPIVVLTADVTAETKLPALVAGATEFPNQTI